VNAVWVSLPSSRPRALHVVGVVNVLTPLLQRATSGVPTPFSIAGAPIARDALALEFGVDRRLTSNVKLGVYYSALLSSSASDNVIKAKLEATF
jgi:fibronectin-binding autotransporter adhesin